MRTYFKSDIKKNIGKNWFIADFGLDPDGNEYILTTDNVRASEVGAVSGGAKKDAELCARLLNLYHNGKIDLEALKPSWGPR